MVGIQNTIKVKIEGISELNVKVARVFNEAVTLVSNDKHKLKKVFVFMTNLKFSQRQEEIINSFIDKIDNNKLTKNTLMRLVSQYKAPMITEIQDSSLVSYMGAKVQHKRKMVDSFKYAAKEEVDTVVDTFLGVGGSIMSLDKIMKQKGIKNLILNDFNPTLLNLHKNVSERTEELIEAVIEIYRTINQVDGNMFEPSQDTLDYLKKSLFILEQEGQYSNVYTSAIFMTLQSLQFGGRYDSFLHDNGNHISNMSSKVIEYDMYFRTITNNIHKIRKYAKMYNSYNTVFMNEGYEVLIENFKRHENVFFLFDPPYYDTKVQYRKNKKRGGGFNQEELLNKLPSLNFLYTNYKVRDVYDYARKYNFHIDEKLRTNKITGTDFAKREYFITSNNPDYKEEKKLEMYDYM